MARTLLSAAFGLNPTADLVDPLFPYLPSSRRAVNSFSP